SPLTTALTVSCGLIRCLCAIKGNTPRMNTLITRRVFSFFIRLIAPADSDLRFTVLDAAGLRKRLLRPMIRLALERYVIYIAVLCRINLLDVESLQIWNSM